MTHQTKNHGPDDDERSSFARGRPTIPGPFGPLSEDVTVRIHPELLDFMRLKGAEHGQDVTAHVRDVIYRHFTGKSYTKWQLEAADVRERSMFGEGDQGPRNAGIERPLWSVGAAR